MSSTSTATAVAAVATVVTSGLMNNEDSNNHNETWSSEAFAQPWLHDVRQDSIMLAIPIVTLFLFSVLYMAYDLFRPTTPFHLSNKLRRTRIANWFVIVLAQMAEMAGFFSLFILEAAPKKTLDQCGLTQRQVYVTHAISIFVRPLGLILFGILIDRFKKLKEGKYLLILALVVQAVLNFGAGTAVALGQEDSTGGGHGGGGGGTHSILSYLPSSISSSSFSVLSSGGGSPFSGHADFWQKAKHPLIIFAYVGGSFFYGISEIVLLKLCAIWYRGTQERATIAGILNISYGFELIVAYVTNAYLYKVFGSAHSLLYVSAVFLSIASLCALFINTHIEPEVDYRYYLHVFNTEQAILEKREIDEHELANLEQWQSFDETEMNAPTEKEIVAAFQDRAELPDHHHNHGHHGHHHDTNQTSEANNATASHSGSQHVTGGGHHATATTHGSSIDEQEIERSLMANEFHFVDPLRHDMKVGVIRMLSRFDLWMYMISGIAIGAGYYGSYIWYMNYVSNVFHVDPKSLLYTFLVILVTLSPALSVVPSVVLNKMFARRKFFGMALLSALLAIMYASIKAIYMFVGNVIVFVSFAFVASLVKHISLGVTRYWSISLGGAAHCGLVTAILLSGTYIGNGIGLVVTRNTTPDYEYSLSYGLVVVLLPLFAAALYSLVAFKNGLVMVLRRLQKKKWRM